MILAGFLGNAGLQNRRNSLRRKALAELHHGGCPKGSLRAVCFHPQKELEVWVFAHMPHRPLVAALQPLLDDERSQRDSRRMRRMPVVHKLLCVLTLHCLPGNQARQLDPFILRIQFPERKNKVLERQLDLLLVHPSSLQCKLFVGSSRFFLHLYYTILGAKTLVFLCFWCFGADSNIPARPAPSASAPNPGCRPRSLRRRCGFSAAQRWSGCRPQRCPCRSCHTCR